MWPANGRIEDRLTISPKSFQLGEWQVNPAANSLVSGELSRQLEPRAMDVLLYLCQRPGEVLSADHLLETCWRTTVFSDNPVHKVITQLRKALGDSSAAPRYIETIRKRGYRVVADVCADTEVTGSWLHESPFRGLHAFEEQHAAIFFGRKLAVSQLQQRMQAQVAAGCALLLILGPSGSGKTSLIRAGLLPQLNLADRLYLDLADVNQGNLFQALGSVLLDCEVGQRLLFERDSAEALGRRLQDDAAGVMEQLRNALPGQKLGLFVDRLEALFRLPDIAETQRAAFIEVLEQLAGCGHMDVVLACRNDFYPQLATYRPLMELKLRGGHFDLNPPDKAEIAQIIRQPVQAADLRFEIDPDSGAGLDEVLCGDAQSRPDVLPLLQYCLQELYRQRGPDGTLSFAVFRALGGIEGAIGARAEQVTKALSAQQAAALPRVLSQLVSISEGELPLTSRHLPWTALHQAAERELVQALVEARLFVSDLHAGVPTFGIAHDALLRCWPRVGAWIEDHRSALQMRTRISAQAARWQASGRSRDFLLPSGAQANQARELLHTPGFQLSAQDQDFIHATLRLAKRGERRRMTMLAVVAGLAILASVLGLLARAAQQQADQHRVEAEDLMGYMLGEFVDKLRPLGRLDLLDSVSGRALSYLAATRPGDHDGAALAQRAKALQVIAEVKIARADPAGARQALLAARQLLQSRSQPAGGGKVLLTELGANAFWLGQIELDQHNWPDAQRYFSDYLAYSERLAAADPNDIDGWIEQSYAHSNLGTVALKRGAIQRAADEFAASIALKTRALARAPTRQSLSVDLANSLSWLASAREKLGQIDEAMTLYRREAELMRGLHEVAPGNGLWTQRYAFSLWHQAELHLVLGDAERARHDFLQAEALLQTIVKQDPSNRSWQSALYTVQFKLLDTAPLAARARIEALQALQARLAILIGLEPKKWNLQRLSAMAAERQARRYWELGQHGEAHRQLATARAALERLQQTAPADPSIRESLAETMLLQADFARAEQDQPAAQAACRGVQALLQASAADSADFHVLAPWARAARCAGDDAAAARAEAQLSKMHYQAIPPLSAMALHSTRKERQ